MSTYASVLYETKEVNDVVSVYRYTMRRREVPDAASVYMYSCVQLYTLRRRG